MATKVFESTLFFLIYDFTPATANAPAGSKIDLVSSNTSFIAAHISSLSTVIISSTYCWQILNGISPTCFKAAPSANKLTVSKITLLFALRDCDIASASCASTPIILISGFTAFI